MADVIVKKIGKLGRNEALRIVPLGDIHIGAAACDEELFKQTVNYIKSENLYWIGMGDYCDFINRKDPRFTVDALSPWIGMGDLSDLAKAQRDRFLDIVRPIAPQCLGLLMGNHETSIMKHYERDIFSEIVSGIKEAAGVKAEEKLALGYSGWIRLFNRTKTDRAKIDINLHHGFVGGKLAGAKALNMQRWLWSHAADLVIFGHSHNESGQREAVESLDQAQRIVVNDRVGCYSGTYLKTTQEGTTTYSEIKGYFPLPMGGCEVYVYPFTKGRKVKVML